MRLKVEYIDVASNKKGCLACQPSGNFLAQLFSVGAVHFFLQIGKYLFNRFVCDISIAAPAPAPCSHCLLSG